MPATRWGWSNSFVAQAPAGTHNSTLATAANPPQLKIHKTPVPPSVEPAHSLRLRCISARQFLTRPSKMFPKPKPVLVPNTYAYESEPMVKATGFREYDARWLFGKAINLMG